MLSSFVRVSSACCRLYVIFFRSPEDFARSMFAHGLFFHFFFFFSSVFSILFDITFVSLFLFGFHSFFIIRFSLSIIGFLLVFSFLFFFVFYRFSSFLSFVHVNFLYFSFFHRFSLNYFFLCGFLYGFSLVLEPFWLTFWFCMCCLYQFFILFPCTFFIYMWNIYYYTHETFLNTQLTFFK